MVEYFVKRNGTVEPFNKEKIKLAIMKAFAATDHTEEEAIACGEKIANEIAAGSKATMGVEEIQDIVEKKLMASSYKDVAKSYITYRQLRTMARNQYQEIWDAIGEKLQASDVQNQNANVDEHSFGGRIGEASGVVTKKYAIDNLLSPMARENHEGNMIYIHDLDAYAVGSHNCLSIPFDDLLRTGFNTRQTDVRPAGSVNTAFQLVAVIFQLQSLQQFGGVSATHLDWTMVPYVRMSFRKHYNSLVEFVNMLPFVHKKTVDLDNAEIRDLSVEDKIYNKRGLLNRAIYKFALKLTKREVYQGVEGMYHNLNTLQSRSGNQLPFTSINYGTCTLPEGRMVTKEILNVSIKGLGKLFKTPVFPCGIFQYWKGVNDKPGTPNYDLYRLALKSTSRRLYPNYANVDWSGNAGYDKNDPRTYFSTINKTVA